MNNILLYCILLLLSVTSAFGQEKQVTVYFGNGRYELSMEAKQQLDSVLMLAKKWPGGEIVIKGHTDSIATASYNQTLAENRAKSVAAYFLLHDIKESQITIESFGETQPVADNNESGRAKNRRAVVTFYRIKRTGESVSATESEKKKTKAEEKDTVIICANGTRIEIPSRTFFPYSLKDVNFNIREFNTTCDLINSNVNLMTDSGDCLTSGGMVLMRPTVDTLEIKPNFGYRIRVSIPAHRNVIDKEMKLYAATEKNGRIVWSLTTLEIQFDKTRGEYFYTFDTDKFRGYNIDKTIRTRCEEDGPIVKVKGFRNCDVYMTYTGELYLSRGLTIDEKRYSLVKAQENKVPTITVVAYHGVNSFMASGPLTELTYRKKKNTYVVPKRYFRMMQQSPSGSASENETLCEYFK